MKINKIHDCNTKYSYNPTFRYKSEFKDTGFISSVFEVLKNGKKRISTDLLLLDKDDKKLVEYLNTASDWKKNSSFTTAICTSFFDEYYMNFPFRRPLQYILVLVKRASKNCKKLGNEPSVHPNLSKPKQENQIALGKRVLGLMSLEERTDDYKKNLHICYLQTKPKFIKVISEDVMGKPTPKISGIGTTMFNCAIQFAKKYGYDRLTFSTTPTSNEFYRKLGIETPNFYGSIEIKKISDKKETSFI